MNDESYFTKTHYTINGNEKFYSDNIDFAPANVKLRRKHKYEKKLLVWIAMSARGISEPFIMASGNAVDQFLCRDNYLAPRLLPFIKINHSDRNGIFWSNHADFRYAEHHLDFLCENLIHYVKKVENPANLPEVRHIEDFWSLLNYLEAKNLHPFEVRIKKRLKEVDPITILKTIGCVKKDFAC